MGRLGQLIRKRWRWLLGAFIAKLLLAVAFFLFLPGLVEHMQNGIAGALARPVGGEAQALHRRLVIADMHADSLLWDRDLNVRAKNVHIDVSRLAEGNVALQIFSSVTKSPRGLNYVSNDGDNADLLTALMVAQLAPPRTWTSLLERSLWHAERLRRYAAASNGQLRVVTSPAELDRLLADRQRGVPVIGAMLSVEGLHDLDGNPANLDRLHAAGFRMAGLAHFFDNDVAGSMHGVTKGGLTPMGRALIRRMEEKGMIVDIAHASHQTVREVLAMARRPVVSSHGGVQATCKENRNLSDDEIRGIARTGGVVGIGYWDAAICSTDPRAIGAAIAHVRDIAGIDHVGLGSDFDGAVVTPFDAASLVQVTQVLIERGFSEGEIAKVMGGNALRVLRTGMSPLGKGTGAGAKPSL
jgi:membrane dipeptidase